MIVAEPTLTPVTVPPAFILATVVSLLLQVPGPTASVRVVVKPKHTVSAPPIGAGSGFTVILDVAIQPVGMV